MTIRAPLDKVLLQVLEAANGEYVPADRLIVAMWGEAALQHEGINARLRVRVSMLRERLVDGRGIENTYKRGYRLVRQVRK